MGFKENLILLKVILVCTIVNDSDSSAIGVFRRVERERFNLPLRPENFRYYKVKNVANQKSKLPSLADIHKNPLLENGQTTSTSVKPILEQLLGVPSTLQTLQGAVNGTVFLTTEKPISATEIAPTDPTAGEETDAEAETTTSATTSEFSETSESNPPEGTSTTDGSSAAPSTTDSNADVETNPTTEGASPTTEEPTFATDESSNAQTSTTEPITTDATSTSTGGSPTDAPSNEDTTISTEVSSTMEESTTTVETSSSSASDSTPATGESTTASTSTTEQITTDAVSTSTASSSEEIASSEAAEESATTASTPTSAVESTSSTESAASLETASTKEDIPAVTEKSTTTTEAASNTSTPGEISSTTGATEESVTTEATQTSAVESTSTSESAASVETTHSTEDIQDVTSTTTGATSEEPTTTSTTGQTGTDSTAAATTAETTATTDLSSSTDTTSDITPATDGSTSTSTSTTDQTSTEGSAPEAEAEISGPPVGSGPSSNQQNVVSLISNLYTEKPGVPSPPQNFIGSLALTGSSPGVASDVPVDVNASQSQGNNNVTVTFGLPGGIDALAAQLTSTLVNKPIPGSQPVSNDNPFFSGWSQIQNISNPIINSSAVLSNISSISESITSQINNVSSAIGIPNPLQDQQAENKPPPGVSQDTSFLGTFQELGSQITDPLINSSGSSAIDGVVSQFQNVGSQISGGVSSATNAFVGAGTDSSAAVGQIPNQLQQIITNNPLNPFQDQPSDKVPIDVQSLATLPQANISKPIQSPPAGVSQDTSFIGTIQGIGSQITNPFGISNSNNSSVSSGIDAIASQFQNIGSQIAGGISNVTNTLTGSGSSTTVTSETTTEAPSNSNASSTDNSVSQDTGIFGSLQEIGTQITQLGSSNSNNSSGSPTLAGIGSQFQNVGSQIAAGISNATSAVTEVQIPQLVNNGNVNLTSPWGSITTGNARKNNSAVTEVLDQLNAISQAVSQKPVTNQLQGIINQLQPNKPTLSNDVSIGDLPGQLQTIGSNILNGALDWNVVNKVPVIGNWIGSNNDKKPKNITARPTLRCPSCHQICGTVNSVPVRRTRIMGGNAVNPPNKYPWNVRFIYFKSDAGQGSLINDRAIITTATIVNSMPLYSQAAVLFNVYDRMSTSEERLMKKVAKVIPHPQYDPSNIFDNNIGIVITDSPVPLSRTLVPICLPTYFESYGGTEATVAGWGSDMAGGLQSPIPLEVTIPLYTNAECSMTRPNVTSNNLCGGTLKPVPPSSIKSTCEGDAGAGLMTPSRINATRLTLIGVTIDIPGEGCGETNQPAVFTNVQNYIDFIIYHGIGCGC